jgi:3',5'-cyclic AMP phosphodiesterase CpdA
MAAHRVVQISDTHLSSRLPWSVTNVEAVVNWLVADPPDLVVHSGDIAFDDVDDAVERAYGYEVLSRIPAPLAVIPGNHDVGDNGSHPWEGQSPNEERLAAYCEVWGSDRFSIELGAWRLIGINNLLCGTGMAAEAEQEEWLTGHLGAAAERAQPVALFMHKPLCFTDPREDDGPGATLEGDGRARLMAILEAQPVTMLASGHLHRYHAADLPDGTATVWSPSLAFLGRPSPVGTRRLGVVEHRFDDDGSWSHELVVPPGVHDVLIEHLFRHYPSLRYVPPNPADTN